MLVAWDYQDWLENLALQGHPDLRVPQEIQSRCHSRYQVVREALACQV